MKILVRAPNWLGDAILCLPALRALRNLWPAAEISILARGHVADLYHGQQVADHLLPYDHRSAYRTWRGRERLAAELRGRGFDLAVLFQNAFDAAWLTWRARIPQRVGYARDGRSLLLTKAIPTPREGEIPAHEQFYYLELLRRAGWIRELSGDAHIRLSVSDESRQAAESRLAGVGAHSRRFRVAIGAGASYGSAKCWVPERFAAVADRLRARFDCDIILFGTVAEQAVSSAIVAAMKHAPIDLTGKTEIAGLPALLSCCQLFIGNDSGAMHVAAAVGLPVVAVFGPTDPDGTAPVTPRHSIVQERPFCSPCFLRRCPIDHRCMRAILPDAVAEAASQWLAGSELRHA